MIILTFYVFKIYLPPTGHKKNENNIYISNFSAKNYTEIEKLYKAHIININIGAKI